MKYTKTTLKNGLRIIATPMPSLESATVTVWVKTGSRMEEKRVNGISHFLEHMVFKGSKKRPTAKDISEAVDSFGGEFNAATNKDWTNFYIKARSGSLETAFDVISDMVLNPILKPEEIEREKGVIVEEIRMHEDTPMIKIADIFEQLAFKGSPLGWDIAGEEKTVRNVKKNDFLRYRKRYYYPENMLITVAGGVKEKEALGLVEKYFGKLQSGTGSAAKSNKFESKQTRPQALLHGKKKEQAHFIMGFLGSPRGSKDKYIEAVLSSILGGGMSSRLFTEIRERRGLAYAVQTTIERYQDTGYVATYAGVDVKRIDQAISVTLDEHYSLASGKKPVSAKELKKTKEYIKGHMALALEDTRVVSEFMGIDGLFLDKVETPEEVFSKIDKVTVKDVHSVAKKLFRPERLNLAIIGPYSDQKRFEKLLK